MTTRRKLCRRNNNKRMVIPLHMDAIEEIIARLPVKKALRCKLLSKYYYNLIQTPTFIHNHLLKRSSDQRKILVVSEDLHRQSHSRMVSTLDDDGGSVYFVPPTALGDPGLDCTTPVGSCNGLLVLQLMPDQRDLTLCNPATRDYLSLPRPNLVHMPAGHFYADALGFCYDPKSDDYKLIKIGNNHSWEGEHGPRFYLIEIWTLKTKTWKQIAPPMPSLFLDKEYIIRKPYYGLFVDGTLYWLAYAKEETDRDALILSFDPTNNSFGQIVLPRDAILARRDKFDLNLIDFNGSLALSVGLMPAGESHNSTRLFDIWVLTAVATASGWTKMLSIGPFPLDVTTTRVCINGKLVLQRIVNCISTFDESFEFILYDPHHNNVVKESPAHVLSTTTTAWSYTESLVSIQ